MQTSDQITGKDIWRSSWVSVMWVCMSEISHNSLYSVVSDICSAFTCRTWLIRNTASSFWPAQWDSMLQKLVIWTSAYFFKSLCFICLFIFTNYLSVAIFTLNIYVFIIYRKSIWKYARNLSTYTLHSLFIIMRSE